MPSEVQAIYALRPQWSVRSLRMWLKRNQFYPIKPVRFEGREIRFRINPPYRYNRFRTERLPNGVYLVFGFY
jgi:hypothetical protein